MKNNKFNFKPPKRKYSPKVERENFLCLRITYHFFPFKSKKNCKPDKKNMKERLDLAIFNTIPILLKNIIPIKYNI